jgi:hypothetical protein
MFLLAFDGFLLLSGLRRMSFGVALVGHSLLHPPRPPYNTVRDHEALFSITQNNLLDRAQHRHRAAQGISRRLTN